MTPGLKFSIRTSARRTMRSTAARPCGRLRSTAIERLLWLTPMNAGAISPRPKPAMSSIPRAMSPPAADSTLMTSAPSSPSW